MKRLERENTRKDEMIEALLRKNPDAAYELYSHDSGADESP